MPWVVFEDCLSGESESGMLRILKFNEQYIWQIDLRNYAISCTVD